MTLDKGYYFIKVDGTKRVAVSKELFTSRSSFSNMFIISMSLEVVSPLHIGTGEVSKIIDNMPLFLQTRDITGYPIIPGASMKGAVSTFFLALTGSIEATSELFGTSSRSYGNKYGPLISKIFFDDFKIFGDYRVVNKPLPALWRPRYRPEYPAVKLYSDVNYSEPKNKSQLVECIDTGAKFKGDVVGYALKPWEVGGLLMSFGINVESEKIITKQIKMGYAKPYGLGKLKVIGDDISVKVCEVNKNDLKLSTHVTHPSSYINEFTKKYPIAKERYNEVFK
jgi:CRISPR/Cas system CSM-associated protein Csm3 (group 7 of RAMP superfamily)